MKVLVLYDQIECLKRLEYTLTYIDNHPLAPEGFTITLDSSLDHDKEILYGDNSVPGLKMPAQRWLFNSNSIIEKPIANGYLYRGKKVFSVEKNVETDDREFLSNDVFGFDIFETIFYHISLYDEYFNHTNFLDADEENKTFMVRNGLEKMPVVDYLVHAFLISLGCDIVSPKTTFSLSHDIDITSRVKNWTSGLKMAYWSFRDDFSPISIVKSIRHYFEIKFDRRKDPYHTYSFLFRPSNKWIRKIVFLMAGSQKRQDRYDQDYKNCIPYIIDSAEKANYSLGLHPSFEAYRDEGVFERESDTFSMYSEKSAKVIRHHYLNFDHRITTDIWRKNEIQEDHTFGYRRRIGFRCGTGFKYNTYDFKNEKRNTFVSYPLVVMDTSLWHEGERTKRNMEDVLVEFLQINGHHTHIMFNFHNSSFDYTLTTGRRMRELYHWLTTRVEKE